MMSQDNNEAAHERIKWVAKVIRNSIRHMSQDNNEAAHERISGLRK